MKAGNTFNVPGEETILEGQNSASVGTYEATKEAQAADNSGDWKRDIAAGGAGILLGAAGAYAATSLLSKGESADDAASNDDTSSEPVTISSVNRDNLSFTDAFTLAREEVGTAGAFEWHGKLYSTFTADEWGNMSKEDQTAYYSRVDWKPSANAEHYIAQAASHHNTPDYQEPAEHVYHASQTDTSDTDNRQELAADDVHVVERHTPEVEVLGVVHDNETDMNIGGMIIDGQGVVVVDVDKDNTFDYAMSDLNHDGELQDNEIADIHDQNVTVDDLGGFLDPDDMYASDDAPADDIYTADL